MASKPKTQTRTRRTADLSSIHAKRAADFWIDVFQEALMLYAGDEGQVAPDTAAERARALADAALDQFEDRWTGVKL